MAVTLLAPRSAGELERTVKTASSTDWDCVIVAGGDGSLKEAMNGRSANTPSLGLMPTGTANVVPCSPMETMRAFCLSVLAQAPTRRS